MKPQRGNENPEVAASWSEVRVPWGLPDLYLVSEIRAVLWRVLPLTCEVWPNSGSWCQNLLHAQNPILTK